MILFIGFATVYLLLDHGLTIRVIGTGLAVLVMAIALFFLLRTLGVFTVFEEISERQQTERALAESQRRLANILWGTGAGTWEWNVQTGETHHNERWAELIGYRLDTLAAVSINTWRELIHPDDLAHAQAALERHIQGEIEYYEAEVRLRHRSGEWIWVLDRGRVMTRTKSGQPEWMAGTHLDITDHKRTEQGLKLAASVFEHANEGIIITDAEANIIEVNRAFTRITGYRREEVIGKNPQILSSGRQNRTFYEQMWQTLHTQGYWVGEIWNRRKNGEVYAELLTISTVYDTQGQVQHYIALFSDISAQKEHQRQLEQITHYDPLTGLPNRVLLADRLRQAMAQTARRGEQIAVACLDLDSFKTVNDTYGHAVGDRLLVTVAERMRRVLREGDTLARLGGDEFVVVLNDLPNIDVGLPLLRRLLHAAAEPHDDQGLWLQVSASLGASVYPQAEPVDADQLLRQADQAMYQAKLAGKNRYHLFDAVHDRKQRDHHEERERIRQALAHQEFVLYYQPKVDMQNGTVMGVEALIRWQHPGRGLLAPGAFLPLIDRHPLMVELGDWVIETALAQISAWRAASLVLPVSVNVDALQLVQADFITKLREVLARYPQVQPSDLELEILETSTLQDIAQVSDTLRAGQALGVSFALDDFGTGYSSLSYLKRLPVATIKIDQSFVRDMLHDPDDLAILEGIISLATAFRRKVVAEGVETTDHSKRLLELGCMLGQGYAIARPMPAEHIPSWWACQPAKQALHSAVAHYPEG